MNSSESGRKFNQAVNTTSKAVGGAILQAKGAFSTFWSTFATPPVPMATVTPVTPTHSHIETNISVTRTIVFEQENEDNYEDDLLDNTENFKKVENSPVKLSKSPVKEIGKSLQTNIGSSNIVEIGREAEILDSNRQNEKIFTV